MESQTRNDTPDMTDEERWTLLDLVAAVQDAAESDAETIATLRHMIERDRFRLEAMDVDDLPWAA